MKPQGKEETANFSRFFPRKSIVWWRKWKDWLNKESRQRKFHRMTLYSQCLQVSNHKINLRGEKTSSLELFTLRDKAENGPG